MKITFAYYGPDVASSRLRARIPQQELAKLGFREGSDVLIYGKHFVEDKQLCGFRKLIFDICDDHFQHAELGAYYHRHAKMADMVTCNSDAMRTRIKAETGRDAVVIREPYEGEEQEPGIGPALFWYGHKSNLADLERVSSDLKYPLMILTNAAGFEQWTPEAFKEVMSIPCIVIIPTGKSQAKSENRMVEAIRGGRYVCAEPLPSYEPFERFFPLGKIPQHIESALANPSESMERIKEAQDYIRDLYSPSAIGLQWLEAIQCL